MAACGTTDTAHDPSTGGTPSADAQPAPATNATKGRGTNDTPHTLRAAYVAAREKNADATYLIDASGPELRADNRAMGVAVVFREQGARIGGASEELDVRLRAVGCEGALDDVAETAPRSDDNRASFRHQVGGRGIEEWYVNGPLGLEQGFTLDQRVACAEQRELVLDVSAGGSVTPKLAEDGTVQFIGHGGAVTYRYTDLFATDATGRELAGRMAVVDGAVRLAIDARGAEYPITVDPMLWTQQAELTASDGATKDYFGTSASVSGGTAVIGAPGHMGGLSSAQGSAYVFVQRGTT